MSFFQWKIERFVLRTHNCEDRKRIKDQWHLNPWPLNCDVFLYRCGSTTTNEVVTLESPWRRRRRSRTSGPCSFPAWPGEGGCWQTWWRRSSPSGCEADLRWDERVVNDSQLLQHHQNTDWLKALPAKPNLINPRPGGSVGKASFKRSRVGSSLLTQVRIPSAA